MKRAFPYRLSSVLYGACSRAFLLGRRLMVYDCMLYGVFTECRAAFSQRHLINTITEYGESLFSFVSKRRRCTTIF